MSTEEEREKREKVLNRIIYRNDLEIEKDIIRLDTNPLLAVRVEDIVFGFIIPIVSESN